MERHKRAGRPVSDQQYREKIKRKLEEGEHVLKIAEEFNISRKVVSKIKSGRSYAWVER